MKEAPEMRRFLNARISALPDLPGPARRSPGPARRGPGPAGGGPGPAGGGPPRAFEGEVGPAFAWGRLAGELLWGPGMATRWSHRSSFQAWMRLASQNLAWTAQQAALLEYQ